MDEQDSLESWSEIRAREPGRLEAYLKPAKIFRDQGRFEDADALLRNAISLFPTAAEPLIEFGWVAHFAGKWDEALDRWEQVRLQFPHPAGYMHAVKSLIAAGRLDEADSLLVEAYELFPDHRDTVCDHAWITVHRGRWRDGLRRFQEGMNRFTDAATLYIGAAFCLRKLRRWSEADLLLADAVSRFPNEKIVLKDWMAVAAEQSDWSTALSRSDMIRVRWPDQPDGHQAGILALIEMGRHEDAETRSFAALTQFPDIADFWHSHAVTAARLGSPNKALERYDIFRARFPADARAYVGAAALLTANGRWAEAVNLLEKGSDLNPDQPVLRLELAKLGTMSERGKPKDLVLALSHAELLTSQFPDFEKGLLLHLAILCESQQFDEAESFASRLMRKFPSSADIAIAHARTASARGETGIAINRFFHVLDGFGGNPASHIGLSEALCAAKRFEEADEVISSALKEFLGFRPIVHEYAQVATRRGDWPQALTRWTQAYEDFPSDPLTSTMLFETRMRLAEMDPDTTASPGQRRASGSLTEGPEPTAPLIPACQADVTDRELVMQFESLGGALLGCEFGMFQRSFGAEPLGLLRWTEIRPDELIKALQNRFAGVGLPENTELHTHNTDKGPEYFTIDKNYYMSMHTFVYQSSLSEAGALDKFCKRLRYLQRKLLDDLKEGQKIFVYKISTTELSDKTIFDIHQAMQNIGNNILLFVKRQTPEKEAGRVDLVKPGLLIGYIDRFAVNQAGVDEGVPIASWLNVCRSAHKFLQTTGKYNASV